MNRLVRQARPEDMGAIMTLVGEARRFIALSGSDQWQDGYPQEERIRRDIEEGIGYVLTDGDDTARAYCALMTAPEPIYDQIKELWQGTGAYITVHRLAVGDALRRKGAGRALLRHAETLAREKGVASLRADTHRMNKAMQGLMTTEGFIYRGDVNYDDCAGDPVRVSYEKLLL